jgi:transposase
VSDTELIGRLGVWEGYTVTRALRFEAGQDGSRPRVWVELEPIPDRRMTCDGCGRRATDVHDVSERVIRDLPVFDAETFLRVPRRRVLCSRCGPRLERLPWLHRYARVTKRLAESVVRLCQQLPIKHVAAFYGLGWDAVKDLDKAALEDRLGPPDLDGLELLAMDEFAIQKGHRYATVIIEPTRKRVLWVGRGRDRACVKTFFELLGPERAAKIRAVAMDMHTSFIFETRVHCPNAEIVFDLFHVVAKYGREVIDRVRVDEANRLRRDKPARKIIKGSRWLLLRNRENVTRREDRVRLSELLHANRAIAKAYLMRDELKHLWTYRTTGWADRGWADWYRRAVRSRIEPLATFARRLAVFAHGIVAHARWPLHTSLLEGINNKIKVIKRMAYGLRDDAYFFLKIRSAFPGTPG